LCYLISIGGTFADNESRNFACRYKKIEQEPILQIQTRIEGQESRNQGHRLEPSEHYRGIRAWKREKIEKRLRKVGGSGRKWAKGSCAVQAFRKAVYFTAFIQSG